MAWDEKFGYFGLREGTEGEEGSFISGYGWFEILRVSSWELAIYWPSFFCEESWVWTDVHEERAGLEERGHIWSRQEVKVEHKVSVAVFTSRAEKGVGEGREEDTTEERRKGEREQRFLLKVTGRGVGGSEVARCRLNITLYHSI